MNPEEPHPPTMEPLANSEVRRLKSAAQRLNATLKMGKAGLSAPFLAAMDQELTRLELVKLKFDDHKDERKQMSKEIAEKTSSHLIWIVGHVAVFYRKRPVTAKVGDSD